ncbi:MAG: glutamate--tRNA ligase [Paracoccaceae bacterium]
MTTTRFAPSPTGYLHIGNLRTALFNWVIARKSGGTFILRLDDTDPARSKPEFADQIKRDLEWLGLTWDRVETQSSRLEQYYAAADALRASGWLYECFETPTELDLKRKKQLNMGKPPVYDRSALKLTEAERDALRQDRAGHWRFKLDHQRITWTDSILGNLSIDAASVSDPVLIRGDGQFLYTLASVCDDVDYAITHVVRGSDHVTNTATQIQIIGALGGAVPNFAHHSLLTGPKGEGLSKRLGTLALKDLRDQGIEPMALLSHMARLGSSAPLELQQDMEGLVAGFDLSSFGAAPTKFDVEDLGPLSAKLLHAMDFREVKADIMALDIPDDLAASFWDMARENINTRADIAGLWSLCKDGATPVIDAEDADFVAKAIAMLPDTPYTAQTWKEWTTDVKGATGRKGKTLFMPLRKALTGMEHGPDMSKLLPLLQKPVG